MKHLTLFSATVLALMTIGCEETPAQNQKYDNHQVYTATPVQSQTTEKVHRDKVNEQIKMHTVTNPQTGQPLMYVPYPASWKFIKATDWGQPMITGPNGLSCTIYQGQNFMYSTNSMVNQTYLNTGVQVMAPVGINNVINQVIIPEGQQMGMTLLDRYPLAEVSAKDREYAEKLAGNRLPQSTYEAFATEWKDKQGNRVLVVLHYSETTSYTGAAWAYNAEMMKVQESNFETAKKQYVYALANKVFDQKDVTAFQKSSANLAEQTKIQDEHFTAMQKIITKGAKDRRESNAAANEHVANVNREIAENKTHTNEIIRDQEINALTDKSVIVSPFDGKEYQVESGNTYYWINDEGKYITSDNALFDPNKYENRPGLWKKAPKKVYR